MISTQVGVVLIGCIYTNVSCLEVSQTDDALNQSFTRDNQAFFKTSVKGFGQICV